MMSFQLTTLRPVKYRTTSTKVSPSLLSLMAKEQGERNPNPMLPSPTFAIQCLLP
jgi:hypothetical protein